MVFDIVGLARKLLKTPKMKRLFLIRHGEAGFSKGTDFQRQLTKLGIEKILRVGKALREIQPEIELMYCSPAQRTMETADLLRKNVQIRSNEYHQSIYDGDLLSLMGLLENTPAIVDTCLVVGHNPIISLSLSTLTDDSYQNMSPGTLACLEFDFDSWKYISAGTGILREIIS